MMSRRGQMPASVTASLPLPHLLSGAVTDGVQVLQGHARAVLPGLTGSEALELQWPSAMSALRMASRREELVPVGDVPGLHVYVSTDGLASSRALVLPELVGQMPVSGTLISLPAPDQLLLLRLDSLAQLDSLPVLLHAHRIATQAAAVPLLPHLLWTDGTHWEAVESYRDSDGAHITPGPALRAALERLASLGWSPAHAALG